MRLFDYAASGNCYKVRLLLAQLGREYERVPVDIFAGETLTPEYFAKNPTLTTPVLELDSGEHIPESGAILLYLAEGSALLPDDPVERADVHRWMFFEQSAVMPTIGGLRFRLITNRMDPEGDEARRRQTLTTAIAGTIDGQLASREFIAAGRYTVADIALYGYLHVASDTGVDMSPYANLAAWLERVRAQPGHIADLEPYPPNSMRGASRSLYDQIEI